MGCVYGMFYIYRLKCWAKKWPTSKLGQLINGLGTKSQCPRQQTHHCPHQQTCRHERHVISHVGSHVSNSYHVSIHVTIHVSNHITWQFNMWWSLWRLFSSQTLDLSWAAWAQSLSMTNKKCRRLLQFVMVFVKPSIDLICDAQSMTFSKTIADTAFDDF